MIEQKGLCQRLGLKGRVIIAAEGINGTLEGKSADVKKYCEVLKKDERFFDVDFKLSRGTGDAFPKLSVRVRDEIVSGHLGNMINPQKVSGEYITAEQLHAWIDSKREFYIVDMRNDFEQEVGHFEGSILPGLAVFADLPKVLGKLKSLKHKTIVTVCTGGVRCEKASGFLVKNGFTDVYQLYGGIVTYMEKYPNEDFAGALYVFDGRIVMGFNMDDPKRKIVGKCAVCAIPSEHFVNCKDPWCNRHFICCEKCVDKNGKILCPMGCISEGKISRVFLRKGQVDAPC